MHVKLEIKVIANTKQKSSCQDYSLKPLESPFKDKFTFTTLKYFTLIKEDERPLTCSIVLFYSARYK